VTETVVTWVIKQTGQGAQRLKVVFNTQVSRHTALEWLDTTTGLTPMRIE